MSKRLVIVAGGTGGHIFPGIAVAQYLAAQQWQISWIGTRDKMEAQVVPKHGFAIDFIEVKGVRGNGVKRLLSAPLMILKAFFQARSILKQRNPDVLLAMGGYVTGPVGLAAKSLGIPLIIHEQNAVAGMSNKLLAKVANKVLCAFPEAFTNQPCEVVGNPVRHSVTQVASSPVGSPINILVVGGSLGAKIFNDTLPAVFAQLNKTQPLNVWHQTGKGQLAQVQQRYQSHLLEANTAQFIDDMDDAYQWADIVICRAGALTVSEIAAAGKMALFVPYPHAVDDHQSANANYLVAQNGALLVQQENFKVAKIVELLTPYLRQPELITELASKAKTLAKLDATEQVVKQCEQLSQ